MNTWLVALFQRLMDALMANWPLVVVGIGGILAALRTLKAIRGQTEHLRTASEAARDSADIMRSQAASAAKDVRRLNRAYLTVDSWTAKSLRPVADNPWRVAICFSVYNPSRTAARIERLDYRVGTNPYSLSHGIMLTPQERYEVRVPSMAVTREDSVFTISGKITYRDIFREERHRTFSQSLLWNSSVSFVFYQAEAIGMNDEEEWNEDV